MVAGTEQRALEAGRDPARPQAPGRQGARPRAARLQPLLAAIHRRRACHAGLSPPLRSCRTHGTPRSRPSIFASSSRSTRAGSSVGSSRGDSTTTPRGPWRRSWRRWAGRGRSGSTCIRCWRSAPPPQRPALPAVPPYLTMPLASRADARGAAGARRPARQPAEPPERPRELGGGPGERHPRRDGDEPDAGVCAGDAELPTR